tara:strand:- start:2720 stop:2929 length:210 start_codon:yes stop_codon:yes gene_type:complete
MSSEYGVGTKKIMVDAIDHGHDMWQDLFDIIDKTKTSQIEEDLIRESMDDVQKLITKLAYLNKNLAHLK